MRGSGWKITMYKMLFYWKGFTISFFLGLRIILTKICSANLYVAHLVDKRIFKNVEQQFRLLELISGINAEPVERGAKVLNRLKNLLR